MTLPAWPGTIGATDRVSFSVRTGVPQSSFQTDFGPGITRPRSTALDEVADVEVFFHGGEYAAFRTWWAETARGGQFTWTRPDTGETVIYQPINGGYSAQMVLAKITGRDEVMRVTFSANLIPAPE